MSLRWLLAGTVSLAGFVAILHGDEGEQRQAVGIGDADAVKAAYVRWQEGYVGAGRSGSLVLPLAYVKGLSRTRTPASGSVTVDLATGSVQVELFGLDAGQTLEVSLVDNRPGPGRSVRPEPEDAVIPLGRLDGAGGRASLTTRLDAAAVAGFEIDLVVAGAPGVHPGEGGLLFGAPGLFQKLHLRAEGPSALTEAAADAETPASSFGALVPKAHAKAFGVRSMQGLIDEGERLFFEETFDGNGRTCGTCHPAENNFTIDPPFIAGLQQSDPSNPLFVADPDSDAFVAALGCTEAEGCRFENPALMEQFGLILENVDGFHNPGVMRGVPHTLALPTSLDVADPSVFPSQATGWSGDGAPGDGSLRSFAIGAVTQHFTQSLNRVAGVDFRLPTDEELDAMEAFQRSLGRQSELDLANLALQNPDAIAGQLLFGTKNCNLCHQNAGASASFAPGINFSFNTDTEGLLSQSDREDENENVIRPVDAGFGTTPNATLGGFGDGTFNTATLVEAADTAPFFHNNAVETLEEAVEFYDSALFNNAQSFVQIKLRRAEVEQLGAFLRTINALENVRSATYLAEKGKKGGPPEYYGRLLLLAVAETNDALQVLMGAPAGLDDQAVIDPLIDAANLLLDASEVLFPPERRFLIEQAQAKLEEARQAMQVTGGA